MTILISINILCLLKEITDWNYYVKSASLLNSYIVGRIHWYSPIVSGFVCIHLLN